MCLTLHFPSLNGNLLQIVGNGQKLEVNCLLGEEWLWNVWYSHSMEYHAVIFKNELKPPQERS